MKKIAILLSLLVGSSSLLASTDPDALLNLLKTNTNAFAYEKEIFSLYMTSDIEKDDPSLRKLYQDALARKKHLDALFDHVKTHKFNKTKIKPLIDATYYQNNILKSLGGTTRPTDLYVINILQAEYMPERDLVDYFLQALKRFAQTPPSQEQVQELYKQVVYTCRMNMNSVHEALFLYLQYQYPNIFIQDRSGQQFQKMNFKGFHDEEDRFYASIRDQYSREGRTSTLDTVAITKMARYCMHPPVTLKNPSLIFELNSLFFYLNIERALLSICPDLVFNPEDYSFEKDVESQKNTFALSRIADYHRKGALHGLMQEPRPIEKKFAPYLKMKDRLLETTLSNPAKEPIDFFLCKLFPPSPKVAPAPVITSKPSQKTQTTSTKKPRKKAGKVSGANTQNQQAETVPTPTPFLDFLLKEEEEENFLPATLEELQELDTLIESAETQRPTYALMAALTAEQPTLPLISPYKTKLHVNDYTYKRCISSVPNGSYLFLGEAFDMPGMFFDTDMLRAIKKLTNHDPESPHLQNMASYRLRFHFRHESGDLDTMDFMAPYQYLSGGRRLDADYRQQNNIKMAFHDYLTPSQAKTYLEKGKDENREFLLHSLSDQVNECVTQGPWHHNCADSEALMVIDLQKEMPTMLQKLASQPGEKITLLGAVLGASSYHDLCWRCRNLFQGWQWGLSDTVTHWKDAYHLPITLSPDFSTIVFGFGEVAPQSHDFYPPRSHKGIISLGTSNIDAKRHKLNIVSLKREIL